MGWLQRIVFRSYRRRPNRKRLPLPPTLVLPGAAGAGRVIGILLEEVVVTASRALSTAASGVGMTIGAILLPANWQSEMNYWEVDPRRFGPPPPVVFPWVDQNDPTPPISVSYTPPPKDLPGFPGARPAKPLGNRKRWTDSDGNILEWDSRHGEIEMYDRTGKTHKGGFDPKTGNQISDPKPGRTTPKN